MKSSVLLYTFYNIFRKRMSQSEYKQNYLSKLSVATNSRDRKILFFSNTMIWTVDGIINIINFLLVMQFEIFGISYVRYAIQ